MAHTLWDHANPSAKKDLLGLLIVSAQHFRKSPLIQGKGVQRGLKSCP